MCRAKGTEYWYHSVPLLLLHKGAGIKVSGIAVKSKKQIKAERKDYINVMKMVYRNVEICSSKSHLYTVWNDDKNKKLYIEDKCILEGEMSLHYCANAVIVITPDKNVKVGYNKNWNKILIIEKSTGNIVYEDNCTHLENKRNMFNDKYIFVSYAYVCDDVSKCKILILDAKTLEIKYNISSKYFNMQSAIFGFLLKTDTGSKHIRDSKYGLIIEELDKV